MAMRKGEGSSLSGVSKRINGRHAFIHERVLELIARETELRGGVHFRKADLAHRLGCYERTLDRAVTRLRREGLIASTPLFDEVGGQLGNEYRATEAGIALVASFTKEKVPRKPSNKKAPQKEERTGH